jgi:signal transduction histidine kinase
MRTEKFLSPPFARPANTIVNCQGIHGNAYGKREKGDVTIEEQEYYAQQIYKKILRIENMVNQLFELSKMDEVAIKPRIEPFVLFRNCSGMDKYISDDCN